jgi:hypothetical protein
MKKPYIPIFAFSVLLLLTIPFSFDFATSVVPGWHTTIIPLYFVGGLLVIIVLLLVTIGYWLLSKQVDKTSWTLFALHFFLTIPTAIFVNFPSIFLDVQQTNQEEIIKAIYFRMKLIPVAWTFFILGQILFIIYFVRTINSKRVAP